MCRPLTNRPPLEIPYACLELRRMRQALEREHDLAVAIQRGTRRSRPDGQSRSRACRTADGPRQCVGTARSSPEAATRSRGESWSRPHSETTSGTTRVPRRRPTTDPARRPALGGSPIVVSIGDHLMSEVSHRAGGIVDAHDRRRPFNGDVPMSRVWSSLSTVSRNRNRVNWTPQTVSIRSPLWIGLSLS
jgi:hypothetical protein